MLWTEGHPTDSDAASWQRARVVIGGLVLVGLLFVNVVTANVAVLAKGPPRAWAGGLLAAWLVVAAVAAWLWLRR